jgi:hypothetical protein
MLSVPILTNDYIDTEIALNTKLINLQQGAAPSGVSHHGIVLQKNHSIHVSLVKGPTTQDFLNSFKDDMKAFCSEWSLACLY